VGYRRSVISTWIGYGFVLVAAAAEYVGRRRRARRISDTYRSAYASGAGLGNEFTGWENEGKWPGT
jgi:hypothetical protein